MEELRYTLLSDGSSDRALLHIIRWSLESCGVQLPLIGERAKLELLPRPPKGLHERIARALDLAPCHLLFVHRDGETETTATRAAEVQRAMETANIESPPVVCVVPVRMTEAWLLFDEAAIRSAAGNPNGRQALALPPLSEVEALADPKAALQELLRNASGLSSRRRRKLRLSIDDVAREIDDFGPLRRVQAFRTFEAALQSALAQLDVPVDSPRDG